MRREGMIALAAMAFAIGFATSSVALDSTSRQRNDTFGWQAPNARMLNSKTEDQLDVNSAGYATVAAASNYSTSAGAASTATTASSVPVENISGIPSCSSGYVLMKSGSSLACVNQTALASDLYGAPSCSSGQALSRNSGGSYSCVSAGGGGGGGGACEVNVSTAGVPSGCWQYRDSCTGATWGVTCG